MNPENRRKPLVPDRKSPGLTGDLRQRIGQRRLEKGSSLRELGKQVGVSAAQLQRIEAGSKHPTPSLLLRILAALDFDEVEFAKCLDETPECWVARRLTSVFPDPIDLGKILQEGRKLAGLPPLVLAQLCGLSFERLEALEKGFATASPGLLATLVRAWNLPKEPLQSLLPSQTESACGVAERYLTTLLEQQGFEVRKPYPGEELEVRLGGDWHIRIRANLVRKSKLHEAKL